VGNVGLWIHLSPCAQTVEPVSTWFLEIEAILSTRLTKDSVDRGILWPRLGSLRLVN
jgi:hypothetical protein